MFTDSKVSGKINTCLHPSKVDSTDLYFLHKQVEHRVKHMKLGRNSSVVLWPVREGTRTNEVIAFSLEALSVLRSEEGDPKRATAVSLRWDKDWSLGTLSVRLVRVQCWKGDSRARNPHRDSQESVAKC